MEHGDSQAANDDRRKRPTVRDLIRLAAIALAITAVVKELRKPTDQRTWHGTVATVVPYDFRSPTMERIRARLWNPEGPLVNPQVFGVGWTINFGAVFARLRSCAQAMQTGVKS